MKEMVFTRNNTKAIKAIAVLLMIIHHLFAFPDRISNDHVPLISIGDMTAMGYLAIFGKICVALFLFLGGLGNYYSYRNHIKAKKKRGKFVFEKIRALYLAYWRVFAVVLPISLFLGTAYVGDAHLVNMVQDFLGVTSRLCGEWWFLPLYILFMAFMPFFYRLSKRCKSSFADVKMFALIYFISFFIWPAVSSLSVFDAVRADWIYAHVNNFLIWLPCFYMGIIFAKRNILGKIKARYGGNYLLCLAYLAIFCILIIARRHMGVKYDCFLAPLLIVAATSILEIPFLKWLRRALVWIGGHSTNMWLIHSFFIYHWCQRIIFKPKYDILIFLFLTAVSIVGSILIDYFWKIVIKLFAKIAKLKIWQFQVIEES
jgi:hypothetical protein